MHWPVYDLLLGVAAGVATVAGGLLALRLRRQGSAILGFSQGAVLGVVLLDILPEAAKLAPERPAPVTALLFAAGLAAACVWDRSLGRAPAGGSSRLGHAGAASLVLHSLMDGLAIGLASQVSPSLGVTVAAAVIAHDVADGVNTVNISLEGGVTPIAAGRWLVIDALSPLAGVLLAQAVRMPTAVFAAGLALLAGLLFYIGFGKAALKAAGARPTLTSAASLCAGFVLIFAITRVA